MRVPAIFASRNNQSANAGTRDSVVRWCDQHLHYWSLGAWGGEQFQAMARRIGELETRYDLPGNRVFYFSLHRRCFRPPSRGSARLDSIAVVAGYVW